MQVPTLLSAASPEPDSEVTHGPAAHEANALPQATSDTQFSYSLQQLLLTHVAQASEPTRDEHTLREMAAQTPLAACAIHTHGTFVAQPADEVHRAQQTFCPGAFGSGRQTPPVPQSLEAVQADEQRPGIPSKFC